VKPSNILLGGDWTAKVSDFSLSLASGGAAAAAIGTVGYIYPELSVVLLELVTDRKAIHQTSQDGSGSPRNVIEFAVPTVETGA
jgi:serine/threonine protein kinase